MAIIFEHMPSKFRKISATQMENVLTALGIDGGRFIIGDRDPSLYEAGMFSDENHTNHYWLRKGAMAIEYFTQAPSTDFSSLAIPFFFQDFAITMSIALDESIQLDEIRRKINFKYPGIIFHLTDTITIPVDEGYVIQRTSDVINILYTERGNVRLLGWTTLPWFAGLAVAWFENYKRIPWTDFLPSN